MNALADDLRKVPAEIYNLPLGQRIRWARKTSRLSHDRLVSALGRSNRGHLIKIEKGLHTPREDLRDAIADVTRVPRALFSDAQEVAPAGDTFRDGGPTPAARPDGQAAGQEAAGARAPADVVTTDAA